jgi:hypothetical protein
MGETDGPLSEPKLLGALSGTTAEPNQGLPPMIADDLRFLPANTATGHHADTDPEGLGNGLLGGKASRQFRRASAAVNDLGGREDTLQEALTVAIQDPLNAGDFD